MRESRRTENVPIKKYCSELDAFIEAKLKGTDQEVAHYRLRSFVWHRTESDYSTIVLKTRATKKLQAARRQHRSNDTIRCSA